MSPNVTSAGITILMKSNVNSVIRHAFHAQVAQNFALSVVLLALLDTLLCTKKSISVLQRALTVLLVT